MTDQDKQEAGQLLRNQVVTTLRGIGIPGMLGSGEKPHAKLCELLRAAEAQQAGRAVTLSDAVRYSLAALADRIEAANEQPMEIGVRAAPAIRALLAKAGQDALENVWPIVNVTVNDVGEVTAAKLYAPGLPPGNHDVYPVRVPYIDEHTEAWLAVSKALEEVAPGYLDGSGNGIECAVKAIRLLAKAAPVAPVAEPASLTGRKIYLVTADTQYEGFTPLKAFLVEQEAKAFASQCNEYNRTTPDTPAIEDTPENDAEWEKYKDDLKAWEAAHPAADEWLTGSYYDYSVREVDLATPPAEDARPAEPTPTEDEQQAAFEKWLYRVCPSGDAEAVQRQWEESCDYLDLFNVEQASDSRSEAPGRLASSSRAEVEIPEGSQFVGADDLADLMNFNDQCEDCDADGYTASKETMHRLAELGVVQSLGFGRYQVTSFGSWVIASHMWQKPALPLRTTAEYNALAAPKAE